MNKILVIGIGSRIMTDDAIGIYLVEDLMRLGTDPDITYINGETDVDYCIEEILKFKTVIVIDAFLSGKQPGEITAVPLNKLNEDIEESFYSMHGMHLLNLVRIAKHSLNGILIGIEPNEINYGFSLSDLLQSFYPRIFEGVQKEITEYINNMEE